MQVYLYDSADTSTSLADQNTLGVNYTLAFVSNNNASCTDLASEWYGDVPVRLSGLMPLDAFGELADTFTVGAGATVTIDPSLETKGTVSGMMISERTGDPIDGAPVRLYPLDGANNVGLDWIQTTTVADGTFVVEESDELLVAGNYKLLASNFTDAGGLMWDGEYWEDTAQGTATVLVVAVGADTALTGSIDRHEPGRVTGTVTEDGSGDPIEVPQSRYTRTAEPCSWPRRSLPPTEPMISARSMVGRSISSSQPPATTPNGSTTPPTQLQEPSRSPRAPRVCSRPRYVFLHWHQR